MAERSARQRQVAASTAASSFTKHPRWWSFDSQSWKPMSDHPLYDVTRGTLPKDNVWSDGTTAEFGGYRAIEGPAAWSGDFGLYNFLRFIEMYLPPRPTKQHKIGVETPGGELLFHWYYRPAKRATRYADPALEIEAQRWGSCSGEIEARAMPPLTFTLHPPMIHPWSSTVTPLPEGSSLVGPRGVGFVLPEGRAPERYVRWLPVEPARLPHLSALDGCLCGPDDFWPDCSCPYALEARYGATFEAEIELQ